MSITINMDKAREITRQRIRAERVEMLRSLDVEQIIAAESADADELARIAAEKQKLRDAPADPRLSEAKTPDALKAALDNILDAARPSRR